MNKPEIENMITEIMYHDGPDRHTDGSDVITDFIWSLLIGDGRKWSEEYLKKHRKH